MDTSPDTQRRRKLRKSRGANNWRPIPCAQVSGIERPPILDSGEVNSTAIHLDMMTNSCCTYYTAVIACIIIINKHKFNNIEGVVNKMAAQVHQ